MRVGLRSPEQEHEKSERCASPEAPSAGGWWGRIAQVSIAAFICEGEVQTHSIFLSRETTQGWEDTALLIQHYSEVPCFVMKKTQVFTEGDSNKCYPRQKWVRTKGYKLRVFIGMVCSATYITYTFPAVHDYTLDILHDVMKPSKHLI